MAPVPPPQGMSEVDYSAIEAAVTETVRGRWFLNEFARRNRTAELRQLLDAMGRIESVVSSGQAALPPADPSIRLLMQRIKEVAGQLDMLSYEMREAGVDERFAAAVEKEARAVSGMMRGPGGVRPPSAALPPPDVITPRPALRELPDPAVRASEVARESAVTRRARAWPVPTSAREAQPPGEDARMAALAALDELPIAEKLVFFA